MKLVTHLHTHFQDLECREPCLHVCCVHLQYMVYIYSNKFKFNLLAQFDVVCMVALREDVVTFRNWQMAL